MGDGKRAKDVSCQRWGEGTREQSANDNGAQANKSESKKKQTRKRGAPRSAKTIGKWRAKKNSRTLFFVERHNANGRTVRSGAGLLVSRSTNVPTSHHASRFATTSHRASRRMRAPQRRSWRRGEPRRDARRVPCVGARIISGSPRVARRVSRSAKVAQGLEIGKQRVRQTLCRVLINAVLV